MGIVKNSYGIADIGNHGISSQGTIGGFDIKGKLKFDLTNGKWTAIYYYNNPKMAIPYNGGYYLHDEMPAYMVKHDNRWWVGTYKQIKKFVINGNN